MFEALWGLQESIGEYFGPPVPIWPRGVQEDDDFAWLWPTGRVGPRPPELAWPTEVDWPAELSDLDAPPPSVRIERIRSRVRPR